MSVELSSPAAEGVEVPHAEVFQAAFEHADPRGQMFLPPGLVPTIPDPRDAAGRSRPRRSGRRVHVRPGTRVVSQRCSGLALVVATAVKAEPDAAAWLASHWGIAGEGDVRYDRHYDQVRVTAPWFDVVLAGPKPIGVHDVQYVAGLHPVTTAAGDRLAQVELHVDVDRVERGRPVLHHFDLAPAGVAELAPRFARGRHVGRRHPHAASGPLRAPPRRPAAPRHGTGRRAHTCLTTRLRAAAALSRVGPGRRTSDLRDDDHDMATTINPVVHYRDLGAGARFLVESFGFVQHTAHQADDGSIQYVEARWTARRSGSGPTRRARCSTPARPSSTSPSTRSTACTSERRPPAPRSSWRPPTRTTARRDFVARDHEGNVWCFGTFQPGGVTLAGCRFELPSPAAGRRWKADRYGPRRSPRAPRAARPLRRRHRRPRLGPPRRHLHRRRRVRPHRPRRTVVRRSRRHQAVHG